MIKSLLRIAAAIIAISLSAQLSFDLNIAEHNIPITGQTLAVLVSALLLPRWEALIAILSYIALGASGQPVFAEGSAGIEKLTGRGAGYIWGFLLATFSVSSLRGFRDRKSLLNILQNQMLGTAIILFTGFVIYSFYAGANTAFQYGVLPFWMGAVIKILVGTALVYAVRKSL